MSIESQIQALEQRIQNLIKAEPDIFLVEVRIKPTNNVTVFLDGDNGVGIDKLIQYNRRLYRQLEEEVFFAGGDFSLEVSSPGLDEPLKMHRQYKKNINRFVEVVQEEAVKIEGKMTIVNEDSIVVEEEKGKGKKKEVIEHIIPFEKIKSTLVQIKF